MRLRTRFIIFIFIFLYAPYALAQTVTSQSRTEDRLLQQMHKISSNRIFDYVKELCSEKYAGRLTGTPEYKQCGERIAGLFQQWGLKPAGDDGTFYQNFPNPYTLVFPDCEAYLHIKSNGAVYKKYYRYFTEWIPGATSGSGEITAEVVYVGYGITAPELGFDEYKDMDVAGKIVLMEPEAPIAPGSNNKDIFMKWRPYTFHQYKHQNAVTHGVRGILYNYGPIGNPNNAYHKDLIYTHVGEAVTNDIFAGTGKTHQETIAKIKSTLQPQSFATGKTFTIKNTTEYHPEGIGFNLNAMVEGSDPVLKNEVIILGGHLDHLGKCYDLMPGANDNASAVGIIIEIADKIVHSPGKPKRSVLFVLFGAEEQGVAGSEYYLNHPVIPLEKTVGLLNMDMVGIGERLSSTAGQNYPSFWAFVEKSNAQFVHRQLSTSYTENLGRPRTDAARFLWKDIPTISFASSGSGAYHTPDDTPDKLNPEIMEDTARILFLTIMTIANQEMVDFRKDAKK